MAVTIMPSIMRQGSCLRFQMVFFFGKIGWKSRNAIRAEITTINVYRESQVMVTDRGVYDTTTIY
jgi:hypothetical protein